jgi:hypothetical protein
MALTVLRTPPEQSSLDYGERPVRSHSSDNFLPYLGDSSQLTLCSETSSLGCLRLLKAHLGRNGQS